MAGGDGGEEPLGAEVRLNAMYDAFNEHDMETAIDQMAADIDWPKAWEPGRTRGREDLRDYWGRMWTAIDARVQPVRYTWRADGRLAVMVDRVVRDLDGRLIDRRRTVHVYELRDDLIVRMDVEEFGEAV